MLTNEYLKRVYDGLAKRNANEPEFLQAVREVLESIQPVVEKHPEYEKAALIEREMTDENINIIRSYETNGSAITIVQSSGIVDDLQHNNTDSQSRMAPGISKEDENLGVVYEEVDGGYVVDGDMFFEYYIVLTGKDPNAAHGTQFIVLTNDQHITYEQVSKSFLSSNSADSLSGTIVIGMKTID